jgi:hypothetical protein
VTLYFVGIKIVFLGVLGSKFGAVTSDKAPPMSSKCVASLQWPTSNGFRIVFSEISNGVVVWNQTFQKPHKFNVAMHSFSKFWRNALIE